MIDKKELGKRLDKLVSVIVRSSEFSCVTCGKCLLFAKRQAGHYLPRAVKATRWDLDNVHVQCDKCNVGLGGNLVKYEKYMRDTYGKTTVEKYEQILEDYNTGRLKEPTLEEMVKKYNEYLDWGRQCEFQRGLELIPQEWEKIN